MSNRKSNEEKELSLIGAHDVEQRNIGESMDRILPEDLAHIYDPPGAYPSAKIISCSLTLGFKIMDPGSIFHSWKITHISLHRIVFRLWRNSLKSSAPKETNAG